MRIGVPREIKDHEFRVALTPEGASDLVAAGHQVTVQQGAGEGSGLSDAGYADEGAVIADDPAEVWGSSDLVVKVKEPVESEYGYFNSGLTIFTYLHLAASQALARALLASGGTALGYETVELRNGYLPLLAPMSEIAGRQSMQIAAHYLEHTSGGMGKLLGGIPGVPASEVVILGAGNVGRQAARVASGLGARVTVMDLRIDRLRSILDLFPSGAVSTAVAAPGTTAAAVARADVVIGATHRAGGRTPLLVTREMVRAMKPLSVIVDVAVDQGGVAETTRPTSHTDPVYQDESVIHYAVPNMPGAVPYTATYALCNATLPYIIEVANHGAVEAAERDEALSRGVNIYGGRVVNRAVAGSLKEEWQPLESLVAG